jgi:hypothetical protein
MTRDSKRLPYAVWTATPYGICTHFRRTWFTAQLTRLVFRAFGERDVYVYRQSKV